MKLHPIQFLGLDEDQMPRYENARVAILPFPYEGGVSYGAGTGKAPDAVIEASHYLELYDEVLKTEPHEAMFTSVYQATKTLIDDGRFVILLGGDHSISPGFFKALSEKYGAVSVVQLDAHADLRKSYQGSKLSHACALARIREYTSHVLQVGIRSMSIEEAQWIEREKLSVCTMDAFRSGAFDMDAALDKMPDPVYITVDLDAFDWSVIRSTGTPEPGGLYWDEAMDLLRKVFERKQVVAFDVVELSYSETDRNSAFAAAKLIYKMIAYKLAAEA
ncbi:MAG: agmatinase [Deltaproteobacteria bacterium]|nr:MAG: agmatinase [Deltaproteobacteria bacterium]